MKILHIFSTEYSKRKSSLVYKSFTERIHLDGILTILILCLLSCGLILLFSASNGRVVIIWKQMMHISLSFLLMVVAAQIHPNVYKKWASLLFWSGLILLLSVLIIGKIGKGAQRWIEIANFRFQPSELMKFAVPMIIAYKINQKDLPPSLKTIFVSCVYILLACVLIAKQPDLGTALMILFSGSCVIVLAGLKLKYFIFSSASLIVLTPIGWSFLHNYQKERILTLFNPERDPLGSGYHIMQSKIAIGSGGLFGKGWFNGSQSHLDFLPERSTDFIFAVCGEEFGFFGCFLLITLYLLITMRALYLSQMSTNNYFKLLSSSLSITFFLYAIVNIGMVTGLLPVVGLPLPLISYGGTSMLTLMLGFGIIMSINSHRKIWQTA